LSDSYTGVKVIEINKEVINSFYSAGEIEISLLDGRMRLEKYQNMFVVLKDEVPKDQGGTASALCRVKGNKLVKLFVTKDTCMSSIAPRNKEQLFAFEMLLDDNIEIAAITGMAGTGKSLLALSAALHKLEERKYKRIILSNAMNQIGRDKIGFLPGDIMDKFLPFNQGYLCNIERLLGYKKDSVVNLMEQMPVEFIPLQVLRGADWPDSFIIIDEAQNINHNETLAFGTRAAENSKVVMLGDLRQRDTNLSREATGIYKFTNSSIAKESDFIASIELIKCERSRVAAIFAEIFEE